MRHRCLLGAREISTVAKSVSIDNHEPLAKSKLELLPPSWVLLTGGQHRLVQANRGFDGLVGQRDLVGVLQRQTPRRDRPRAGKAAMAEPAQHVPADTPTRHADRECRFGAEGPPPTLARGVWTAHQI